MNWQLLWFVLAGFVLGFALSTLWEWVYYRGLRQQALIQYQQAAARTHLASSAEFAVAPADADTEAPPEAGYRTPAVFIEGEQAEAPTQPSYEPLVASWTPPAPPVTATPVTATNVREESAS